MGWKKPKQQAVVIQTTDNIDKEAMLHEAYMLVRHLHVCYPNDEELLLRLSRFFEHTFSPPTVKRLLEALQRPFAPSTDCVQKAQNILALESNSKIDRDLNTTMPEFTTDGATLIS